MRGSSRSGAAGRVLRLPPRRAPGDDHERSATWRRRALVSLCGVVLGAVLAGCGASAPGAPGASQGATESRAIPSTVDSARLVDQAGTPFTLGGLHGKVVMLVPFLTLCTDICPMTTGNLLQVQQALRADHLVDKVAIVELSVDPRRDTTARLAAYGRLTGASWKLARATPAVLAVFDRYFGIYQEIVPEDRPASIDWWTGKPLTYDVNHSDGYFLIDATGRLRFTTNAAPGFKGSLAPRLNAFLSPLGRRHLAHPVQPAWTPKDALAAIGWLLGRDIPSRG